MCFEQSTARTCYLIFAMKYIALLSGGKDSCYNLLHCHKNGHELVAAASLRPEPGKGA
jgi:diphthine-ammonia ligase